MKRILASAWLVGVATFGLVGCDQTTKTEETSKISTPGGTDTKKVITEDKKTGDLKEPGPSTETPK